MVIIFVEDVGMSVEKKGFCRAQILLAENFVQFCSPIFSHIP